MTTIHPVPDGADTGVSQLDGNAVVGVFADVFSVDPSVLVLTCGHCGVAGPLGGTVVEDDGRCAIVRCRACTRTLLTLVRAPDGVSVRIAALAQLDTPHPSVLSPEVSR
ncbi:DUF6510 family protein [Microbacterium sp. cx-55]|uniref:DUF6510 family protein n=1 Tax=Microbacterium sp. cx-55 TaxID=2875948 RepID=UPI001CBAF717|nr:DUF6510 family protein [Microbacterium sp. cx-55]MBZ4486041.1 DUF6510 family protein [Microbacterium sp. cx-55]UGB34087.1 DUF6510 family protein [Microbacterium sp. cx-55]